MNNLHSISTTPVMDDRIKAIIWAHTRYYKEIVDIEIIGNKVYVYGDVCYTPEPHLKAWIYEGRPEPNWSVVNLRYM